MPLALKIAGGNRKGKDGLPARREQPAGQLSLPKTVETLVRGKIIGAAVVILSFGVLLSVDTASQVRKEMMRGEIAHDVRSAPEAAGKKPTRSPWRHVLLSAIPASLVATAAVIGLVLFLARPASANPVHAGGDWTAGDIWSGRRPLTKQKPWLNGLLVFILLVAISYAAGFVYQVCLSASGLSVISPWTALVHKMLGVWIATILGLGMGIEWTAPRTSHKVEARKGFGS